MEIRCRGIGLIDRYMYYITRHRKGNKKFEGKDVGTTYRINWAKRIREDPASKPYLLWGSKGDLFISSDNLS